MKKTVLLFVAISLILSVVSGCMKNSKTTDDENLDTQKIQFIPCHIEWYYYETVDELVNAANCVVEGKITDISFKMINETTGNAVKEPNEQGSVYLYTIYEIEVQKTYMGKHHEKIKFGVFGGIPGYKEQEQIDEIKKWGNTNHQLAIHTIDDRSVFDTLAVGESYMFALCDFGCDYMTIPNLNQTVFTMGTGDATATEPSYNSIVKFIEKSNKNNK